MVEMAIAKSLAPDAYYRVNFEPDFLRMVDSALSAAKITGARAKDTAGVFPLRRLQPEYSEHVEWDQWAKHIENRATSAGFPRQLIEPLLGALIELQDNVFQHSCRPESGLVAYAISRRAFELVTGDAGIGVLASLKKNPEFQHITDSGSALRRAASDGTSRFGADSGHGYGIGQLFRALARYDAEIRFRSGDHALSLWGDGPSLTGSVSLAHKAWLQGLTISVRCEMPRRRIQLT